MKKEKEQLCEEWAISFLLQRGYNVSLSGVSYTSFSGGFPILNHPYYYLSSKGKTEQKLWQNSIRDNQRLKFGNVFKTREEVHEWKQKINKLKSL